MLYDLLALTGIISFHPVLSNNFPEVIDSIEDIPEKYHRAYTAGEYHIGCCI